MFIVFICVYWFWIGFQRFYWFYCVSCKVVQKTCQVFLSFFLDPRAVDSWVFPSPRPSFFLNLSPAKFFSQPWAPSFFEFFLNPGRPAQPSFFLSRPSFFFTAGARKGRILGQYWERNSSFFLKFFSGSQIWDKSSSFSQVPQVFSRFGQAQVFSHQVFSQSWEKLEFCSQPCSCFIDLYQFVWIYWFLDFIGFDWFQLFLFGFISFY